MLQVIENDFWQIGVLPGTGSSIAFGRIRRDGRWIDFMRATPETSYWDHRLTASYVLVPWSNRIKDGLLRFRGRQYQLRVNYEDGTAIHGTGNEFPWTVETADKSRLVTSYTSAHFYGVNFPWRFSSRCEFRLDGKQFSLILSLKNEDTTPMPAGFGHHPYFQRVLGGEVAQLEIPCSQYYVLENCIPTGAPVPIPPRIDFQKLRALGNDMVDDAMTGRAPGKPIRFVYPETEITLRADEVFQSVILYAPTGKPYYAVEAVSNANDGFNLYDRGIPGSGVFVLEPGEEKRGAYVFEIVR